MSEKNTLKFKKIGVNKKEFKQPIDLKSASINQIVVSDRYKAGDEDFKYFIGYQDDEIVKLLCIILSQMSGYTKYFENCIKSMSFMVKDDNILDKCNKIWNKIKEELNIKFHSKPVYDETYIKGQVREFDGVIKTNFSCNEVPKENMYYTCITCINIDSVMRMSKKNICRLI